MAIASYLKCAEKQKSAPATIIVTGALMLLSLVLFVNAKKPPAADG
jgi:hypothetical protein